MAYTCPSQLRYVFFKRPLIKISRSPPPTIWTECEFLRENMPISVLLETIQWRENLWSRIKMTGRVKKEWIRKRRCQNVTLDKIKSIISLDTLLPYAPSKVYLHWSYARRIMVKCKVSRMKFSSQLPNFNLIFTRRPYICKYFPKLE